MKYICIAYLLLSKKGVKERAPPMYKERQQASTKKNISKKLTKIETETTCMLNLVQTTTSEGTKHTHSKPKHNHLHYLTSFKQNPQSYHIKTNMQTSLFFVFFWQIQTCICSQTTP